MVIYILKDLDPAGGIFAAQQDEPNMATERTTIVEVRMVPDFPNEEWVLALSGELPVDEDFSNDSTWSLWWDEALPVWVR